jgi:hypothetical protein
MAAAGVGASAVRLDFASVRRSGARGFADWVRALVGQDGVYIIRDAATGAILYIGESHRGRLYHTLTRHFQAWSGFGSGPTYHPDFVEVAVILTDAATAPYQQFALIQELRPLDNVQDGRSVFRSPYAAPEPASGDDADFLDDDGSGVPF